MTNTIDLIKAAQNREYINFEDKALTILKTRVQENPKMNNILAKLNVAQGLTEAEGDNPEEEGSDLQKEYDAYFSKKLKAAGAESPADLDEEGKKKFFNDISAGWVNGKGEK